MYDRRRNRTLVIYFCVIVVFELLYSQPCMNDDVLMQAILDDTHIVFMEGYSKQRMMKPNKWLQNEKLEWRAGGALYQLAIQAICFSYEWLKDKCAEYLMTMLTRCMLGLGNNNACSVECVCRKQSCKWTRLLTIFSKFYFPTVMEKNGNLSLSVYMQCMWELWMNRNITSSLTKKHLIAQGIN